MAEEINPAASQLPSQLLTISSSGKFVKANRTGLYCGVSPAAGWLASSLPQYYESRNIIHDEVQQMVAITRYTLETKLQGSACLVTSVKWLAEHG